MTRAQGQGPRAIWLVLGWALATAMVSVGGCTLSRQGILESNCNTVEDCKDPVVVGVVEYADNPCTTNICLPSGTCQAEAYDAGTLALVQPPFDCQSMGCQGGQIVSVPDDSDVATASCVDASCTGGVLTSMPKATGTPCTEGAGQGSCDGMGECIIVCMMPDDPICNDGEACTNDSCNTEQGICVREPLDAVPPEPDPNVAGDCKVVSCVQGVQQTLVNQQDVLEDNNDCTDNLCDAAGNPSNPPRPVDTACGALLNLLCDGAGTCANCNSNDDCGNDTQCLQYLCQSTNCFSNPLTGQACNNGLYCDGADTCDSNGNCTITAGNPCPGPDADGDCSESCREANDDCNGNDTNNSACTDGNLCTAGDTCQTGNCTAGPNPCAAAQIDTDGDCSEACNSSTGLCTEPDPTPHGCNDGNLCTTGETCSAGNCQGGTDPCATQQVDTDADCSEACNSANGLCELNDPTPHPCTDGLFCTVGTTCSSGSCTNSTGTPCQGPDGDGNCAESCDETNNNCLLADPNGSPCNDGDVCTTPDTCTGGVCGGAVKCPQPSCEAIDCDGSPNGACDTSDGSCDQPWPNGTLCDNMGSPGCQAGACTGGSCI